jgi:putative copper resistance protein D
MESTPAQVAATAAINISFAWTIGVLACRLWLIGQAAPWQQAVVRRLAPAMLAGLAVCIAAVFLSLWTESAIMGDVAWLDAWPVCVQMMTTTHYGRAGAAAMALLVVAMVAHPLLYRCGAGRRYVAGLGSLLLSVAAARVAIGHAYGPGPFSVAAAAQWLHLLCMALWAGTVFVAGGLVLPRLLLLEPAPSTARAAYLGAMSKWATAALAGVLATGAYNAWRVLGSPADLVAPGYGRVLLVKILLVLIAIGLGGYNRFSGLPASLAASPLHAAQRGLRTVIAVLRIEALALLLAFVSAAILANNAPPGH